MVKQYESAKTAGKLIGLYHYAGGGDPIAEANFFLKTIKNYIGTAILVLDWEGAQTQSLDLLQSNLILQVG